MRCHPADLVVANRRQLLAALSGLTLAGALHPAVAAGPAILAAPSNASVLIARAVDSGALSRIAPDVSFATWRSPDELRAAIVSGRTTAFTLPTNVAANLYNRGLPIRLVSVIGIGHMHVLTLDPSVTQLEDLRGKRLQLYFRNDLPDVAMRYVLGRFGLVAGRDVSVDYAGSAVEATQLVLAGRAATVLLNEPAASSAMIAARRAALPLRRAFTLQQAWAAATGVTSFLPLAGLAVTATLARDEPEIVRALHQAILEAADWVRADPAGAGRLAEKRIGFRADAMTASLEQADVTVIDATTARPSIEAFLGALAEMSPDLIGGQLPGDSFYTPV